MVQQRRRQTSGTRRITKIRICIGSYILKRIRIESRTHTLTWTGKWTWPLITIKLAPKKKTRNHLLRIPYDLRLKSGCLNWTKRAAYSHTITHILFLDASSPSSSSLSCISHSNWGVWLATTDALSFLLLCVHVIVFIRRRHRRCRLHSYYESFHLLNTHPCRLPFNMKNPLSVETTFIIFQANKQLVRFTIMIIVSHWLSS